MTSHVLAHLDAMAQSYVLPRNLKHVGLWKYERGHCVLELSLSQAGLPERRAQLLRERQRTTIYESIVSTSKDGIQRGADELVGTGTEDAASQEPNAAISEREQALWVL